MYVGAMVASSTVTQLEGKATVIKLKFPNSKIFFCLFYKSDKM